VALACGNAIINTVPRAQKIIAAIRNEITHSLVPTQGDGVTTSRNPVGDALLQTLLPALILLFIEKIQHSDGKRNPWHAPI
jgi:hypothetical protein